MKIFISWSGELSHDVATVLWDWLRLAIPSAEPFMSEEDIRTGRRGGDEIARELDAADVGIVCVTRANVERPWINFEAGAIAKRHEISLLMPLYIDLHRAELPTHSPLALFQDATIDKRQVKHLVHSINRAVTPQAEPDHVVEQRFEAIWPQLEGQLRIALEKDRLSAGGSTQASDVPRMVFDILELMRLQYAEVLAIRSHLRKLRADDSGCQNLSGNPQRMTPSLIYDQA